MINNIISTDNSVIIEQLISCSYDLKVNKEKLVFSLITQDTNSIALIGDGTLANPLQGNIRISSNSGNLVSILNDGLYVASVTQPVQNLTYDTMTKTLSLTPDGNSVTLDSPPAPQTLSFNSSTYVLTISGSNNVNLSALHDVFTETSLSVIDTNSIDFTTSGTSSHTLTGSVRLDGTTTNLITVSSNGLLVAPITSIPNTPLVVTSTASIAFSASGTDNHHLTGNVNISTVGGNIISILTDGLYVPTTTFTETILTTVDSQTIHFSTSGTSYHNLTGVVKVSAVTGNILTVGSDGLYVPPTVPTPQVNSDWTATTGAAFILNKPTAGTGISFSGNTITNTAPAITYSGGTGISVSGSVITNTAPNQVVSITAGTGISIGGSYPSFSVTNTAPNQVVSLTAGTNVSISGSYPNFTINATGSGSVTSVNLTAGTGISVSGGPITTSGSITVVNTAPDQTVTLTNGGNITISGSYPNFTLTNGITNNNQLTNGNSYITTNGISGTLNYIPKYTSSNTIGNSAMYDTGSGISVGAITAASTLDVTGTFRSYITQTFVSGTSYAGSLHNIATYTGTLTATNASFSASENVHFPIFNGNTTVANNTPFGCVLGATSSSFSSTGTVTANAPIACLVAQTQDMGSVNGTISLSAGVEIKGVLLVTGATATIIRTNHYQLYIQDTNQFGNGGNITNKYAIYAAGTSDKIFLANLGTGSILSTGGLLSSSSDGRLKDTHGKFTNALDAVNLLPDGNYYTWKSESEMPTNISQFSMFADEVYAILGEEFAPTQPIKNNDSIAYHGLNDRAILSLTIQALKELTAKVKILEAK